MRLPICVRLHLQRDFPTINIRYTLPIVSVHSCPIEMLAPIDRGYRCWDIRRRCWAVRGGETLDAHSYIAYPAAGVLATLLGNREKTTRMYGF
jgi:hypothetical protein